MKQIFSQRSAVLALILAGWLVGCHPSKKNIQYPLTVKYEVSASDSAALDLVETYYATDFRYTAYDTVRFTSLRNSRMGSVFSWFDGTAMYVRETNGRYCSCTDITGEVFDFWMDGFDSPSISRDEKSYKLDGRRVYNASFVREETDTTWLVIDEDLPNVWFDFPWMPGLPVDYSYRLRDGEVHYRAVSTETAPPPPFDPQNFSRDCVRIPPEAWVGEGPASDLAAKSNRIWLYGYMYDENENLLSGEVGVGTNRGGVQSYASAEIAQGSFDLELIRGYVYTFDFKAAGTINKRMVVDCSNVPEGTDGYLIEIDVELFEQDAPEVSRFLENTTMMRIFYAPDSANFMVDDALAKKAAADLDMMRQRMGARGRQ